MPTTLEISGDLVDFDAVVAEEADYGADVTEHQVERGAAVADHVRARALTVRLECAVTELPTERKAFGFGDAVIGLDGVPDRPLQRARAVVDRLRAAQVGAELGILRSATIGVQRDMAVAEVREPRAGPAGGVVISVTLRQVRVAAQRVVSVPEALLPRDTKTRDRGRVQAVEQTGGRKKSLAAKIVDYF